MKKRCVKNLVPGGERIFQRIYTRLGCEGRPPNFVVEFHPYTDLTHMIRLREDTAYVRLSDALDDAPHPVPADHFAHRVVAMRKRRQHHLFE